MLLPHNYTELIFKTLFLYANYFHIIFVITFISPFIYRRMLRYEWFQRRFSFLLTYRMPSAIRTFINGLFIIYKVVVLYLLHVMALATLPLLFAYFWNIKTVGVLAEGRKDAQEYHRVRYNPFRQYHALYRLMEGDKGVADRKYKDFSYGFWLLIAFFIFNPTALGSLILLLLVSFWPFLLQLRMIYQINKQEGSSRLPFLLMLCTFNLAGSWSAYRAILKSKNIVIKEGE